MIDKIKLKTSIRFLIGGVCAASIPFVIGLILLTIPIIAGQDSSCHLHAKNTALPCSIYQDFGREFYWLIMLPIILSFIFVAPIVAALSISDLQESETLTWRDIFLTSIAKSSKANFWVAIAYNMLFLFILIGTSIGTSGFGGALGLSILLIIYVALIQFGLWVFITLPLSIICAAVFGLIARPQA